VKYKNVSLDIKSSVMIIINKHRYRSTRHTVNSSHVTPSPNGHYWDWWFFFAQF